MSHSQYIVCEYATMWYTTLSGIMLCAARTRHINIISGNTHTHTQTCTIIEQTLVQTHKRTFDLKRECSSVCVFWPFSQSSYIHAYIRQHHLSSILYQYDGYYYYICLYISKMYIQYTYILLLLLSYYNNMWVPRSRHWDCVGPVGRVFIQCCIIQLFRTVFSKASNDFESISLALMNF